jgi:hypothetical protein
MKFGKIFLLALLVAMISLSMTYLVACGDDDDDDDDTTTTDDDDADDDNLDDDNVDDDVADDDVADDDATDDCTTGMTFVYDCDFALYDVDSNPLTLADAIAACQADDALATCAAGCGLASMDCTELETCLNDNCA